VICNIKQGEKRFNISHFISNNIAHESTVCLALCERNKEARTRQSLIIIEANNPFIKFLLFNREKPTSRAHVALLKIIQKRSMIWP
jgi:hypothetical protein